MILKRILCFFGFHKYETIVTAQHEWVLPDDQQLILIKSKCKRCGKEIEIMHLIIDFTKNNNL